MSQPQAYAFYLCLLLLKKKFRHLRDLNLDGRVIREDDDQWAKDNERSRN